MALDGIGDRKQTPEIGRSSPLSILAICIFAAAFEGFDNESLAFVATGVVRDWGVELAALGTVFSAGYFGLVLGSLFLAPLADRAGRRPVILVASVWVMLATLSTAFTSSILGLAAARFTTGLGLGTMIPLLVTVAYEVARPERRVIYVTSVMCGFPAGSFVGALIVASALPRFGWASVFVGTAFIGAVIAIALFIGLPRNSMAGETRYVTPARSGLPALLRNAPLVLTLLLWGMFISALVVAYNMASWLPALLQREGFSVQQALVAKGYFSLGGVVGALGLSYLVARRGRIVIAFCYVASGLCVACYAFLAGNQVLLIALSSIAGFLIYGGYACLNAMAPTIYPEQMRATGVGWAQGIGRLGSGASPMIIGAALAWGWGNIGIFLLLGGVACLTALMALLLAARGPDISDHRLAAVTVSPERP